MWKKYEISIEIGQSIFSLLIGFHQRQPHQTQKCVFLFFFFFFVLLTLIK